MANVNIGSSKISKLRLLESSVPATPASGYGYVYAGTDGNLYFKNDAGSVYNLSQPFTSITLAHSFARQINTQTIATGSGSVGTIVNFDSVISDALSCVTTGVGWKYTAPRTGLYTVSGMIDLGYGSNVYANLYIDGVNIGIIGHTPSDGANARCLFSATILLSASNYISIQCLQYSGSNKTTNIGAKPPYNSYISIIENPSTIST